MSYAQKIVELAAQMNWVLSTAESCTGGMVAASLTDIPGSSNVFEYGFVTYSNTAKTTMLGVPKALLKDHGAVSEQVVKAMALGAMAKSGAHLGLAISGIAGPGGSDHKPEGRVCFGISTPTKTFTQTIEFGALGRAEVRKAACDYGLRMILKSLEDA